jgi:DNA-binding transcriptional MerR regulator
MDSLSEPPATDAAPTTSPAELWRIDDLAQQARVSVDTIRYYQREGLLASGERVGRTLRYGPEHLERLERIRNLQTRRFSLAAIRALLDHDGSVENLLAGRGDAIYDHDALIEAAGVSNDLVRGLEKVAVLRLPDDHGRDGYDAEDVDVLQAFGDLAALGIEVETLVEFGEILRRGLEQVQREVNAFFDDHDRWPADSRARFHANAQHQAARVVRDVRVINEYVQHRAVQRKVLDALQHDPD